MWMWDDVLTVCVPAVLQRFKCSFREVSKIKRCCSTAKSPCRGTVKNPRRTKFPWAKFLRVETPVYVIYRPPLAQAHQHQHHHRRVFTEELTMWLWDNGNERSTEICWLKYWNFLAWEWSFWKNSTTAVLMIVLFQALVAAPCRQVASPSSTVLYSKVWALQSQRAAEICEGSKLGWIFFLVKQEGVCVWVNSRDLTNLTP